MGPCMCLAIRQAMLSVPHVFLPDSLSSEKSARRHYAVKEGDHLTLLNVYNGFEVPHHAWPLAEVAVEGVGGNTFYPFYL